MIETLFASQGHLWVQQIEGDSETLDIYAQGSKPEAVCPHCQQASQKVHSRYQRHPRDVPCLGLGVQLHITVRRFFCQNPHCYQRTFAESFPSFLDYKARRTQRLRKQQLAVAYAVSGEAGRRLLQALRMPVSGDTLIREIRLAPEESLDTPRVLGIDDWAQLKGQTYGTILVDLESHRPVDVLDTRETEAVVAWLQDHPDIEIIARDRSLEYAKAAKEGAPQALQVADRWHLLKNLRDAIETLLMHKPAVLQAAANEVASNSRVEVTNDEGRTTEPALIDTPLECQEAPSEPDRRPVTKSERVKMARQARRQARYERVCHLHQEGYSVRAIAKQMKLGRRTVKKYIAADTCPQYTRGRAAFSILTPYLPYLERQWQAGCTNATQLWREIVAQGFSGSRSLVSRWAAAERTLLPQSTRYSRKQSNGVKPALARVHNPAPWSAPRASWLLVKEREHLDEKENAALARITAVDPQVATVADLAERFRRMVKQRECHHLQQWLFDADQSGIQALMSFANGIRNDLEAVRNALSMIWSSGQTEGQINRLKFIKRTMYGRANFDLLRKRVLYRPQTL